MDNLIHLPPNQKALCKREVEDVLKASLALLDASSSALDAQSQMKESILTLESAFRRGSVDEGIQAFFISRKKMIKKISKRLVELMKAENACASIYIENDANIVNILTEAQVISLLTLKSVFSHLKTRRWSTIANLSSPKTSLPMQEMPQVYNVAHSLPVISEKQALKQRQH